MKTKDLNYWIDAMQEALERGKSIRLCREYIHVSGQTYSPSDYHEARVMGNVRNSQELSFQYAEANLGSWRSILFSVYSRKAAFPPILSQRVPRPSPAELQPTGSCSPKTTSVSVEKARDFLSGVSDLSTERLGKIVAQRLQDRAREDLLQKVAVENVVAGYSKSFNSCVCLSPLVIPVHPIVPRRQSPLLHTPNGIVRRICDAEIDAVIRKELVEPIGDDPYVSTALKFALRSMIEENNRRIIGHCTNCYRGYTVLDQLKDGKCQSCANHSGKRSW